MLRAAAATAVRSGVRRSAGAVAAGGATMGGGSAAASGARAFSVMWPTAAGENNMHGTTILSVRRGGKVVVIGDGQISQGHTVVKGNAIKVRRIGGSGVAPSSNERFVGALDDHKSRSKAGEPVQEVLCGFAGATADALTLLDRLEKKLEQYPGQLTRCCVELAKNWRTDKYLRRLEAIMVVVDKDVSLTLTGNGDVISSPDGVVAVGSGGLYALSAARALMRLENDMDPEEVARRAMDVAAELCVYTNKNYTIEVLNTRQGQAEPAKDGAEEPRL
jgi:ATP-dependent HslUV protease subunit HslV